jgi:hypothetical protein
MNKGLEIILKRIDTHPEEFDQLFRQKPHSANPTASWDKLVEIALSLQCSHSFLTADERAELKAKIQSVQGDMFTKAVMRTLFAINGDDLRYYAAHTGRWGGDDKINMQNLPRGSQLKKAMRAPEGYVFIDCDLSQIEARTLAWLAQQHNLVAAFENGDDVYKIMASSIYGKPTNEISKDERFVGKTTILGAGYGMGPNKFQQQLKNFGVELDLRECERIIKVYRKTYKKIPELWYQAGDALEAMMRNKTAPLGLKGVLNVMGTQGIEMPNKLRIQYANLRKQKGEDGKDELVYDTRRGRAVIPNRIYGGKVIENVCQALARIVIGEQLLRIAKKYKVVMTVHDAIGCIAPEAEADEAMRFVEESMKVRPTWALDLPLDCEGGYAKSYGEC